MPSVLAYHRPQSLDEAQKLASEKNAVLIGGGTLVTRARTRSMPGPGLIHIEQSVEYFFFPFEEKTDYL